MLVELLLSPVVGPGLDEGGIRGLQRVYFGVQVGHFTVEVVHCICQIEPLASAPNSQGSELSLVL